MMFTRRMLLAFLAAVAFAGPSAADAPRFTAEAFDAAQAAGKPILVHVTAPWCITCKAQKPVLSKILAKRDFASLAVFEVDFDSQKDALRRFEAKTQSLMIVFKGATEIARELGRTEESAIEALLRRAL